MPTPYDLSREELAGLLDGEPAYRVRQVWDGLHQRVQRPRSRFHTRARTKAGSVLSRQRSTQGSPQNVRLPLGTS